MEKNGRIIHQRSLYIANPNKAWIIRGNPSNLPYICIVDPLKIGNLMTPVHPKQVFTVDTRVDPAGFVIDSRW